MLLNQKSCGNENRDLFSVLNSLKCGANSNLCLSIPHITTHNSIHWMASFHIALDFINCRKLVNGLYIGKCFFKFTLPRSVRRECKTRGGHSSCVELNQLSCNLLNRFSGFTFCTLPVSSTYAMNSWGFATNVPGHLLQCVCRNKKSICWLSTLRRCVLNHHIFPRYSTGSSLHKFDISSNTVLFVNYVITRFQFKWINGLLSARRHSCLVLIRCSLSRYIFFRN